METKETHLRNYEQSVQCKFKGATFAILIITWETLKCVQCEYEGGTFAILIMTDKRMESSKM